MTVTQANRTREQQLHQRVVSSTTQLLCIIHRLPPWTPTIVWRSDTTGNKGNSVPTYGRLTLKHLYPVNEYPAYPTSSLGTDTPMLSTQLPQCAPRNRVNNEPCAICKKQTTHLQHAARALRPILSTMSIVTRTREPLLQQRMVSSAIPMLFPSTSIPTMDHIL